MTVFSSDMPIDSGESGVSMSPLLKMPMGDERMNRARVIDAGLVLAMAAVCLLPIGAGAVELPAGPNKDVVVRACGSCHDLDMVYEAAGQSREGWNGTIEEMAGYGLKLTSAERAQVLDYLTSFLGPEARKPR
jgi:hypothetical protein